MVIFFDGPESWREWLEENHLEKEEQWVGFHKRATGKPSLTWPQSVDEALCFGWIDGRRQSVDAKRYKIRFTPRKPTSKWSLINIRRVTELRQEGRMQPAGEKAFAARKESGVYSYEQPNESVLPPAFAAKLKGPAKKFLDSQAPWYQRAAIHWVVSAKQEATRERRFAILLRDSAAGRPIPPLKPYPGKK